MRSAVQARFSNHTFKSGYSSLGKRKKKLKKKKYTYPISEQSVNRELGRCRETEPVFTAHTGIFPKDDGVRTFFAALLTSCGGCVLFFAIRGFSEHKIPFPMNAPKKNGQPERAARGL